MNNVSFWQKNQYFWIVEVYSSESYNRLKKWKYAKVNDLVGINHYRRQFLIPASKVRLAHKLFGLEYKKNSNRVKAGQQAAINHPIRRGQRQ